MHHGIGPETTRQVCATKEAAHVLFDNAHGSFGPSVESMSISRHRLHGNFVIVTVGFECSAFGKLSCTVKPNGVDCSPRQREEFVN